MIKNNFKKFREGARSQSKTTKIAKSTRVGKLETRMDLMFIRNLKEAGKPVIDDPETHFN